MNFVCNYYSQTLHTSSYDLGLNINLQKLHLRLKNK